MLSREEVDFIVINFVKIIGMPCIISIRAIPVVNTAYTKER